MEEIENIKVTGERFFDNTKLDLILKEYDIEIIYWAKVLLICLIIIFIVIWL